MISFALTEDQAIARRAAAEFARAVARPAARAADEAEAFPAPLIERAWALGLVQAAAGEETLGQPAVLAAIVLEEIGHGDAALAVALAATLGFVRAIAAQGTPAQRSLHLPAFTGDAPRFAAVAHVDAAGRTTRARRDGAGWRLDGVKTLVPLAGACSQYLVTAETEDGACAFVMSAATPGVAVAPSQGTLGLRALRMADVVFENASAPAQARLPGGIRRVLDASRVALAAMLSGLARGVYEYALPYSQQRVVHGEAIARKQAIAFKLADMHIAAQAMRWMALRAACDLDAGLSATRNAALAKRYAAQHGVRIADEGVQVFGGHGFMRDLPLEIWYRNAQTLAALDGLAGL